MLAELIEAVASLTVDSATSRTVDLPSNLGTAEEPLIVDSRRPSGGPTIYELKRSRQDASAVGTLRSNAEAPPNSPQTDTSSCNPIDPFVTDLTRRLDGIQLPSRRR